MLYITEVLVTIPMIKKEEVESSDIYDLASITKVTASVPNLMKLVEDGELNLDYNLCDYLDYVDTTKYINMNIRGMLAHNAGWFLGFLLSKNNATRAVAI